MRRDNPPGLIQTGNITQKLVAALGIRGKTTAPRLGDLVHPVVITEDLTKASWYNQAIERPAGGGVVTFTPTVGQYAVVGLYNPSGSGVVIIVDLIVVAIGTGATAFTITQSNTAPAALVANGANWRDVSQLTGAPVAQVRTESSVAPGGGSIVLLGVRPANDDSQYAVGGIYPPGNGIRVNAQSVTNAVSVAFLWRERFLDLPR